MYTLGVDLGGTNIAIGLCDDELRIIDKGSVPTKADRKPELIIKDMAELASRILERNNLSASDIEYVGIAAPGTVNSRTGTVEYANNLPFLDFPIAEIFKSFMPVKRVIVANDANAAALAEALVGAAKGTENSVMITLGTGVGGGVIINGKIFDGGVNCAGAELGHTVIVVGGRQCSCGRLGCWEAYSSATALTAMTKEKMTELKLKGAHSMLFDIAEKDGKVSARTAFKAMKMGDAIGKEIVDKYIFYLAEGITNMINIFQPEVLSIGGGVCNEKENLTVPLIKLVERDQYTRTNPRKARIVTAELGNDAGIIGAAGLGR
ncbi:MAG: ROK family protein [Ruminococcaceae bacterium]|nr:ROK family protein [Oscillospiraceae bacterium]